MLTKPDPNDITHPIARGKRLRKLRQTMLLSRRQFSEKHNIPLGTLQNWEDARYYRGLGEKGARRVMKALAKDHINCTMEWLLYGIGTPPIVPTHVPITRTLGQHKTFVELDPSEDSITQELLLFHQLNHDAIDMIVPDDLMAPVYWHGDIVAGQRLFGKDIETALDRDCIVQLKSGEQLIRQLQSGTQAGHYQFKHYNSEASDELLEEVAIFSAAPIVWIRRQLRSG